MNKERMGQFLSQLRKEYVREDGKKGLTMSELAAVFNQKYFETTPATIKQVTALSEDSAAGPMPARTMKNSGYILPVLLITARQWI